LILQIFWRFVVVVGDLIHSTRKFKNF